MTTMTIKELRQRISEAKAQIVAELPLQTERAAADLAAAIKNRIVQKGINAKGQRFSPYSEKKGPAFRYLGRSRNKAGEAMVAAFSKRREPMSYKDFRTANGLNTGIKNFEFTGEMWRTIEIGEPQQSRAKVRVRIQGGTPLTKTKLEGHTAREGVSLLDPTPLEIKQAGDRLRSWVFTVINNRLG